MSNYNNNNNNVGIYFFLFRKDFSTTRHIGYINLKL